MASPSTNMDIRVLAAAWREFQNRTSIKFCAIESELDYQAMVEVLDELVDAIGDRETHPMMGLLDIVSFFVRDYEERNYEFPKLEPKAVLRFLMEQHNLRHTDLGDTFGSHENVGHALNGKREITPLQAKSLAARFHLSPALFIRGIRSTG